MARSRYSQVKFYEDMKEALAPSKVKPIKYARPASIGSGAGVAAKVGEEWLAAYLAKQKKDAEAADIKAARAMADTFYKPQPDWNVETDGTTPDTLRAATMPGALTADVGEYDPDVMPFPEQWDYDGEEGQQLSMNDALGAPNAALGSPLDPGQAYAVGTDEEGDDANWMTPAEHKEFYENEALNAQAGFDAENLTGLPAVMEADRGGAYNTANGVRGPRSDVMLAALRGEGRALEREEAERVRATELADKVYDRQQKGASLIATAKVEKDRLDRIANLKKLNRVKNPQQLAQELQIRRAGVPPTATVAETSENKAYGTAIVDREQKVYDRADGAAATMSYLNLAKSSVNDNSQASGLATILSKTAGFLGVPLPDDFEKKATKSQNFDGMMGNILAEKLAAQKGPQTDRDADRMMQTLASLRNTTEARIFLLDSGAAMASRDLEQGRFYSDFRAENGTIAGAENAWRNRIEKRPLFGINKNTKLPVFYYQFQTRMKSSNPEMSSDEIEQFWNEKYGGDK